MPEVTYDEWQEAQKRLWAQGYARGELILETAFGCPCPPKPAPEGWDRRSSPGASMAGSLRVEFSTANCYGEPRIAVEHRYREKDFRLLKPAEARGMAGALLRLADHIDGEGANVL